MGIGIIGGADGPTAVLVAGPSPMSAFVIGIVIGVALTLAVIGIIKLIKKNKKK